MSISKKKKTIIIISVLIVVGFIVGAFYLGRTTVKKTPSKSRNNQSPNDNQEIEQLKTELTSLKNELSNLQDNTKKNQLESQLSSIENKVQNLTNQEKQDKSTIKKLEKELKEIKEKLRNDGGFPNPNNKSEQKFIYGGYGYYKNDYLVFDNIDFPLDEVPGGKIVVIFVSKNHPQVKKLLNQGKLQKGKQFTIRYGLPNKIERKVEHWFEEDSQELEIKET